MSEAQVSQIGCARGPTGTEKIDPPDVGALLNQCLGEIVNNAALAASREVASQTASLQSSLEKLVTALEETQKSQRMLDSRVQELVARSQLLERASQERAVLSEEHHQHHVIEPMIRLLFPVIDVLDKAKGVKGKDNVLVDRAQWAVVEQIQIYMNQFLSAHSVTVVRSQSGAPLNPKVMKPVQFVACQNIGQNSRVAKSLQAGFVQGTGRVLRFESVALYRYEHLTEDLPSKGKETRHGTVN
jgi:molecular chaperone GrpE (heat shock protein)